MNTQLELPEYCYVEDPVSEKAVRVVKGVMGYFPVESELSEKSTKELNEGIGVTDIRIAEAMLTGSMFGWNVPGADPNNYDEDLNYIGK